eukprot:TRINITY_DN28664_c0_g1_i2.p1 TRINITY_DN28664_c0_g1~~TRINITY_DN28664_c0_g1_i2.p1  ORF type:complete len:158 (+),score=24.86 TRINITY_DN28664_c0_g1_i2:434-907(+)
MIFFGVLLGVAHVVFILPMLMVLDRLGFPGVHFQNNVSSAAEFGLILLAAMTSSFVHVGSLTVIALRTPVFFASMQTLVIPLSVVFDMICQGYVPKLNGMLGYVMIFGAFVVLADIPISRWLDMSSSPEAGDDDADEDDVGSVELAPQGSIARGISD